jgi:hypothetical protein
MFGAGAMIGVLIFCLGMAGCYGCSHVTKAEGYRDCTVRKLSYTGLLWKTWECEAVGDGVRAKEGGAVAAETFAYTVEDPTVIEALKALPPNKRVRLHYRKMAATWEPKGESPYFVTKVEHLDP